MGESVEYGGETYETVKIGNQNWFKRNLNYEVEGSRCFDNSPANCDKYGKLYDWATAMNLNTTCNTSTCASQVKAKHQGICPDGWHIPSNEDWNVLMKFVDASCSDNRSCGKAGTKLKATSGWPTGGSYKAGTDNYGFSALPSGYGNSGSSGDFFADSYNAGFYGVWWSSSEKNDVSDAYYDIWITAKLAMHIAIPVRNACIVFVVLKTEGAVSVV